MRYVNGLPPIDPAMNPGCFFPGGRGVYEVEEELLALHAQLSPKRWRRIFQWQRWKLWFMWHQYWPTTVKSVLIDRQEYYAALERYKASQASTTETKREG